SFKNPAVKLQRALYGLKQAGRNWYMRLRQYLLSNGFSVDQLCPCVFIKAKAEELCIIAVYVDDLNLTGTRRAVNEAKSKLMQEFDMKDMGEPKLCLGLQIERTGDGVFLHQRNLIVKILKRFNMSGSN